MALVEKDEAVIRSYLLGELSEEEVQALEQRVMCDDEFSDRVLMIEDAMVEEYIDAKLETRHRERLESLLLSTPQGEEQLRFTRALKEYATKARPSVPMVAADRSWWRFRPPTPAWALAVAAVILLTAGVETFRRITSDSELSKGLQALNSALPQRPIDARISVLDYRVRPNTRGDEPVLADTPMLRQAELTLRAYAERKQSSRSLHALGCVYLAKRDLEKAIDTLNEALALDPNSPQIHSDLGAVYLEKGKAVQRTDPGAAEPEFSRSLDHINKALELDPASLDARFNRALLYQQTQRVNQALDDWQEYLKRDDASPWANEARANIRAIENQK